MSNSNLQKNKINLQNILNTINDLPEASSGVELPTLTNEGTAANLLIGKELIDQEGVIVTGTMADNGAINVSIDGIDTKSITIAEGYTSGGTINLDNTIDNEVSEQADLITQIREKVNNLPEACGGDGINIAASIVDGTVTEITAQDLAGATKIRGYAFFGYSSLTSVEIPNSVTSIGNYAFNGCNGLTSIVIPDSVTSIGGDAFNSCKGFTSIIVPDNVISIGARAFQNCSNLINVIIGNGVTTIGESSFSAGDNLKSVEVGYSVTTISNMAFYYNRNLKRVDFSKHTKIPTLKGSSVFSSTHADLQIKVSASLIDQWKTATNWSALADKIVTEFTNTL